jgi:cytidylate kinase
MAIVAMSPTLGSLGEEIGRKLAQERNWGFADQEIIMEAAGRFGEPATELAHVTEEKPSLWERWTDSQRRYLTFIEAILWEMAARDNMVLCGRGAVFALGKVRHALRVRVTASETTRARRVEQQQGLTAEAAQQIVHQSDRERSARLRFLYHVDWNDPIHYDLILNTERMDAAEGLRLVSDALTLQRLQPTAESVAEVRDSSLAARAQGSLLCHPSTKEVHVSVNARQGQLTVRGMVDEEAQRKAVEAVVAQIPGVTGVLNEMIVTPRSRTGL